MTLSDGIRNFSAYFRMFVERFINFFLFSIVTFQKSVITTVKGYKVISPGKEGTEPMEKSHLLTRHAAIGRRFPCIPFHVAAEGATDKNLLTHQRLHPFFAFLSCTAAFAAS